MDSSATRTKWRQAFDVGCTNGTRARPTRRRWTRHRTSRRGGDRLGLRRPVRAAQAAQRDGAERPRRSTTPAASAARGTGTATPAPGATPRSRPTATRSTGSCSTSGTGTSATRASTRSSPTSTTSPTATTSGAASPSTPRSSGRCSTRRPTGGTSRRAPASAVGPVHRGRRRPAVVDQLPQHRGSRLVPGAAYHTSRWPHEGVDLRGKRVGVIGTGSSGVQCITEIAPQVDELYRVPTPAAVHRAGPPLADPARRPRGDQRRTTTTTGRACCSR